MSDCRSIQVLLVASGLLFLVGCAGLPGTFGGPLPTPTALIDPYNNVVATAEAAGDARARAAAYYERGNIQLDLGDASAAIDDYTQAIALDPGNARAFHNRGLALVALGQGDQALADYSEAIRLDPLYVRAYRNRLVLLEQRSDLAALAADYAQNGAAYHYREGSARYGLRDRAGAQRAFDAALRADPQHVDALYERGLLNFAAGEHTAAIEDFDAALRLSPRAANAYYARGLAYSASNDDASAINDFTRALELQSNNPAALIGRASAAHALGRNDEAQADLKRLELLEVDSTLLVAVKLLRQQLDGK